MSTFLKIVHICIILNYFNTTKATIVDIPQGSLVGLKLTSILHNKTYYSFKGIPYAEPRTGEQKFDPPRSPKPWKGLLNATNHREVCPQYNLVFDYVEGEEDCLYLNVYTPVIDSDVCKPVMLWIYGGGFNIGQGNYDYYGGDYLVERDVVVVTINYRLGPIGFLCTGDENAPGNVGLKDQTYALRWVRNNIHYFGGCSQNVTIFGSDAGAVSVGFHLLSPMSRGLFSGAIMQSGSITDAWGFNVDPKRSVFALAERLNITAKSTKEVVEKLKKIPYKDLVSTTAKFFMIQKDIPNYSFLFIPCIDVKVEQEEQFLSDTPMNLLQKGDIADVPVIIGVNEDEGSFEFTPYFNVTQLVKGKNETLRKKFAVEHIFNLNDPEKISDLYNRMYKFYFNDTQLSELTVDQMIPMVSDVLYIVQSHVTSMILSCQIKSNIYKYVFGYKSDEGAIRPLIPVGNASAHADELEHIFFLDAFASIPEPNTNAYKMNHLMTKMWTNFAKDGNPTSSMDDVVNVEWKPLANENNIMYIDVQPEIRNTFFNERMSFWMRESKHILGKFVNMLI